MSLITLVMDFFTNDKVIVIGFGLFGGFVYDMNSKNTSIKNFINGTVSSLFIVLLFDSMFETRLPHDMRFLSCGVVGFSYKYILTVLKEKNTVKAVIDRYLHRGGDGDNSHNS